LDVVTRAVLGFDHHGIDDWRAAATHQRGSVRTGLRLTGKADSKRAATGDI